MRRLATLVLVLCASAAQVRADAYDPALEKLIGPPTAIGQPVVPTTQQITAYRSLMSEMSVILAPTLMTPADSLGWSGFQLSVETTFTQISRQSDFWQKGASNPTADYVPSLTVFARKGIWLPAPSFEIGAGGTKFFDSSLYAMQLYAKFAIHEGFHDWPLPSFALRAAVARVFGSSQMDMTILSFDLTVSKSFGLGGKVKIDPYVGFNPLVTLTGSQVIDTTPGIDAFKAQNPMMNDLVSNAVFPQLDAIVRWRLFTGFRLVYGIFGLSGELAYTLCNDTGGSCGAGSSTKVVDRSHGQLQMSFAGSLIF